MLIRISVTACLVCLLFCGQVNADSESLAWEIDAAYSSISFVSVKKTNVAESHHFTDFSGAVDADGKAEIIIKADSVDTQVAIRDERMREFLFETGVFPEIKINTSLDNISALDQDNPLLLSLPASLSLHGVEKDITLDVLVSPVSDKKFTVASTKPVLIKASDYNLDKGIAKLSSLVGDISIGQSVPVSFVITYTK